MISPHNLILRLGNASIGEKKFAFLHLIRFDLIPCSHFCCHFRSLYAHNFSNSQKICFLPIHVFLYGPFSILFYEPSISLIMPFAVPFAITIICLSFYIFRLRLTEPCILSIGCIWFGLVWLDLARFHLFHEYNTYLLPCLRLLPFLLIFNISIYVRICVLP